MSFQEKCSNTSLSGRPPLGAKVRVAALSIWSHSSAIAPCHPNVLVIMFFYYYVLFMFHILLTLSILSKSFL